jgi:hypothetical protein
VTQIASANRGGGVDAAAVAKWQAERKQGR